MPQYVALLRGIAPTDPRMRNDNLRRVVEELGFTRVRTVISSGNVLFESALLDRGAIEATIETAWPRELGFRSTTIVRSREQIQRLVEADPYGGLAHGPDSYLLVTFFQQPPQFDFQLPHQPAGKAYRLHAVIDHTLFSISDLTSGRTPDLMDWLERRFGKQITSRTWRTVQMLLTRMS